VIWGSFIVKSLKDAALPSALEKFPKTLDIILDYKYNIEYKVSEKSTMFQQLKSLHNGIYQNAMSLLCAMTAESKTHSRYNPDSSERFKKICRQLQHKKR